MFISILILFLVVDFFQRINNSTHSPTDSSVPHKTAIHHDWEPLINTSATKIDEPL
jgi:hypothetical protein